MLAALLQWYDFSCRRSHGVCKKYLQYSYNDMTLVVEDHMVFVTSTCSTDSYNDVSCMVTIAVDIMYNQIVRGTIMKT